MESILYALFAAAAIYLAVRLFQAASVRRRSEELVNASVAPAPYFESADAAEEPWLTRWLAMAGYRDSSASLLFFAATAAAIGLAAAIILLLNRFQIVEQMVSSLIEIPGGIGDLFAFVAKCGPYLIFVILSAAPTLWVRAARRQRVEAMEQDLAPTLELLATLAEAGLGFDAAVARIHDTDASARPLGQEFRIYQRDVLAGIPRLESLQRLAERTGIAAVSNFTSAMIQADQVGASLSETLRTQADDLRDRRKMRALLLAQALPVKLVFPLIACFLPGIFFSTLGPVLNQLVEVFDSVIKRR